MMIPEDGEDHEGDGDLHTPKKRRVDSSSTQEAPKALRVRRQYVCAIHAIQALGVHVLAVRDGPLWVLRDVNRLLMPHGFTLTPIACSLVGAPGKYVICTAGHALAFKVFEDMAELIDGTETRQIGSDELLYVLEHDLVGLADCHAYRLDRAAPHPDTSVTITRCKPKLPVPLCLEVNKFLAPHQWPKLLHSVTKGGPVTYPLFGGAGIVVFRAGCSDCNVGMDGSNASHLPPLDDASTGSGVMPRGVFSEEGYEGQLPQGVECNPPSDGLCLYHCIVAAKNVRAFMEGPNDDGVVLDPVRRARDAAAAEQIRAQVIAFASEDRDEETAARLRLPGKEGYPGTDELRYLARCLGGRILLRVDPLKAGAAWLEMSYGSGQRAAEIKWTQSIDGAGHESDH